MHSTIKYVKNENKLGEIPDIFGGVSQIPSVLFNLAGVLFQLTVTNEGPTDQVNCGISIKTF